ncbi:MAG: GAF domain-containing protein [candidate division Zixibacteria bacterium]|nr:GAF domain-containing protein [candidate division Zixibacteria bacterium]
MATGFLLLALAVIAIIVSTRLSLNGFGRIGWVWFGATLMSLAALGTFWARGEMLIIAEIGFVIGFAVFAAVTISQASRAKNGNSRNTEEIQSKAVSDILHVAATRDSLIELLNYSLDRFLEIMSLNSGAIHIHHAARNTLVMGAYRGLSPLYANKLELIRPGQTAIGRALQNRRVLIIRDLRVSPDYEFFGGKAEGYSFLAVAPIMVENDCWGVITIIGRKRYERGMLDIALLEQFGRQLGQALQLGKQNRAMAASYAKQRAIIDIYEDLLGNIDSSISEKRFQEAINRNRGKLFDGKSFWLLKVSGGMFQLIAGPQKRGSEYVGGLQMGQLSMPLFLYQTKPRQLFDISDIEFKQILPGESPESRILSGCGFGWKGKLIGAAIIDDKKENILRDYSAELAMLSNLVRLVNHFESWSDSDKNGYRREFNGLARELDDLFEGISGHVQLLMNELKKKHDADFSLNVERWLKSLEDAAGRGTRILDDIGRGVDANAIIQTAVKNNNLNVEFVPDPLIPPLKINKDEFKETISEILSSAILDNRKLTVKASANGKIIGLTIEGAVKPDFPSPDLLKKARLVNIELKVAPPILPEPRPWETEINPNGTINVVVAENRDIIKNVLVDLLGNLGCKFSVRSTGGDTIAYIDEARRRGEIIDAVIADTGLEDIPGLQLCRQIKTIDPKIKTIIISSWGTHLPGSLLNESSVDAVLYKPFRLEQLKQILPLENAHDATSI